MPGARRALPILLALAALGLGACGSDNSSDQTIPSGLASQLLTPIGDAQQALEANDCSTVRQRASDFSQLVSGIGADQVDADVKQELIKASAQLKALAATQCTDTGTTDNSGASGAAGAAVGSTDGPTASKKHRADSTSTDSTSTTEAPPVAAKPEPPGQAKKDEEAKAAKPEKQKKPKKHPGKSPNGPPGPKGNPNHGGEAEQDAGGSGGIAPKEKH